MEPAHLGGVCVGGERSEVVEAAGVKRAPRAQALGVDTNALIWVAHTRTDPTH